MPRTVGVTVGFPPNSAEEVGRAGFNYDGQVPPRLRSRQPQVDALRGQLNALVAGRGSVLLVTGRAGMGKTTLLAEATRLAADQGIRVFYGGGDPWLRRCRSGRSWTPSSRRTSLP